MATILGQAKKYATENIIGFDNAIASPKTNTLKLRRTFFYTHGMDSRKFAEKMVAEFAASPFDVKIVDHDEVWNAWPKSSYFEVILSVTEKI